MRAGDVLKRILDIIFSFLGAAILSPFFLIIALLIKCESKGSVLFKQKRIGKNKKEFTILKFRTMRRDAPCDIPTHMFIKSENYVTRIGRILRKTSLDETPQLFNILKGDMSFIGPRPALWNQYDLAAERDKYGANSLRPGLTGWAQVNGRDDISIEKKARLDGEYVKKRSLGFDLKIFFMTFGAALTGKGIVEGAQKEDDGKGDAAP